MNEAITPQTHQVSPILQHSLRHAEQRFFRAFADVECPLIKRRMATKSR